MLFWKDWDSKITYSILADMSKFISLLSFLIEILLRIPDKTPDHDNHDKSNRESANDTYALDIAHTALRKYQCDWKYDQEQTPQKRIHRMRLFVLPQFLITVAGGRIGDGIKRSGIERDHAHKRQNQDKCRAWHSVNDVHNKPIQIAARLILCNKIRRAFCLKTETVIAENNKAYYRRTNTKDISAENSLPDRSSAADVSDKEWSCDADLLRCYA